MESYDPSGGRSSGGNHAVVQTAGTQKFLIETPLTSIQEGRYHPVPMMGGVTRQEGSFIVAGKYFFCISPFSTYFQTSSLLLYYLLL